MGIPTQTLQGLLDPLARAASRWKRVTTTADDDVIVSGPPAGFVRLVGGGSEMGFGAWFEDGADPDVAYDLKVAGAAYYRNASHAKNAFISVPGIWLEAGEDLTIDYVNAPPAAQALIWAVQYVDLPADRVFVARTVLTNAPQPLLPTPQAGKAYAPLVRGEWLSLLVYNGSAAPELAQVTDGTDLIEERNFGAYNIEFLFSLHGTGFAASAAGIPHMHRIGGVGPVTAHVLYVEVDLAAA